MQIAFPFEFCYKYASIVRWQWFWLQMIVSSCSSDNACICPRRLISFLTFWKLILHLGQIYILFSRRMATFSFSASRMYWAEMLGCPIHSRWDCWCSTRLAGSFSALEKLVPIFFLFNYQTRTKASQHYTYSLFQIHFRNQ